MCAVDSKIRPLFPTSKIEPQFHEVQNQPVESGWQHVLQLQAHEVLAANTEKLITAGRG